MVETPRRRSTRPANTRRTTAKQRKQQHVLDVVVRVDQASRQRQQRLAGVLSKCVVVVGLGAGLYFGISTAVTRLLFKNPEYNIAELNVETDGVLSSDIVVAASDLHKGANIFKVDLGRARARVEAIPQVEKAQVTRQLPNKISIQVTERKPIAWIATPGGPTARDEIAASSKSFLIDARGILLQPGKTLPQDHNLPIIRNYTGGPLSAGIEAEGEEIKSALDLLHARQDLSMSSGFQIQEIDLARHYGLNVLGESGVQVLFGLDDMDKQLKHLDVYLQTLEPRGQRLASINLLAQRNIPVTFITEPVAQPSPDGTPTAAAPTPGATPALGNTTKAPPGATREKEKDKAKSRSHASHESHANHETHEKAKSRSHSHDGGSSHKAAPASTVQRALPVN